MCSPSSFRALPLPIGATATARPDIQPYLISKVLFFGAGDASARGKLSKGMQLKPASQNITKSNRLRDYG